MNGQTDKAAVTAADHEADSPGNDRVAPGRYREAPPGWIAAGHQTEQARPGAATGMVSMDYQNRIPTIGADLATVYGNEGPLASSILEHQGKARVQVLDQVAASTPGYTSQVGMRAPGGIAPQPADHIAPTSAGPVQPRPVGPAGMMYERTRQQTYHGGPVT